MYHEPNHMDLLFGQRQRQVAWAGQRLGAAYMHPPVCVQLRRTPLVTLRAVDLSALISLSSSALKAT